MLRFGWYVFSREERRLPTHEEAEWPGSSRRLARCGDRGLR
jgi:hypothetical protein